MLTLGLSCVSLCTQLTSRPLFLSHVFHSFALLVFLFCFHPPLLYLSSLDFHCHLSHLFSLPVHYPLLSLPTCSFHLPPVPPIIFVYLFPEAGALRPPPVSAATHSPGFALCQALALPYGLGSPLQLRRAQTNLFDGPPCFPGWSCHGNKSVPPPDTTSGWRGAESPTHPKATHPIWPPSMPPSSFALTCWPPRPAQWKRSQLLPPERWYFQPGWGGLLKEGRR